MTLTTEDRRVRAAELRERGELRRAVNPLELLREGRTAEELRADDVADREALRAADAMAVRLEPPSQDLYRMNTDIAFRAVDDDEEGEETGLGTMIGYAAVFNDWTTIDSWEGRFKERLMPGTFKKTIRGAEGKRTKALYNHGWDPYIGQKPLGPPETMREDTTGLWTETPLLDTSYNRDLAVLLEGKALDGMSFRMEVIRDDWEKECDHCRKRFDLRKAESNWYGWTCPECERTNDAWNPKYLPERTIKEVRMPEYSAVTFPAYTATTVGIRSADAFDAWVKAGMPITERRRPDNLDKADFPADPRTAPPDPAATADGRNPAQPGTTSRDAPPDAGHPSDAPADSGHPSPPERTPRKTREQRKLRAAILREHRARRDQRDLSRYTREEADGGRADVQADPEPTSGH
jgi:HK97 family phage prohead protease